MIRIVTDWRYLGFAAGLAAIVAASATLGSSGSGASTQSTAFVPTTSVPASTPEPAHTPTQSEIVLDAARNADLAAIAEALSAYHQQFNAYPSTYGGFQLICANAGDAACVLRPLTRTLPSTDPSSLAYWYKSDGATFTLFAHGETQPIPSNCPRLLPPALSSGPILCVNSPGSP